jgi:hypothetical protein
MLLAAFVSSRSREVEAASELPNAGLCRSQNNYDQLLATQYNFSVVVRDREVGTDWLHSLCIAEEIRHPRAAVRLRHSAVWYVAKMTLEINLCELTAPFERCVLEAERMETRGNSLRFWNGECIKWVKNIVSSSNLLLLRREISLCGEVLKGQRVMLIKLESFGAFLSWLLRREMFLTGDVVNEFYCIQYYCFLP